MSKAPRKRELSPKQQRFVDEYLIDLNATQAATRAGYSQKTASSQGERLLRNAEIQRAIAIGQSKLATKAELNAQWVIDQLRKESQREGRSSSPSARVRAIELIGKHIGMFRDIVEHLNSQPIAIEVVWKLKDQRPDDSHSATEAGSQEDSSGNGIPPETA
jgi:phage terminase small subunit